MPNTTDTAAHAAQAGAEGAKMPQLDFSTFGNQIFWLVVALVVIYLVLTRIALPRISGILAERRGTITNDIALAEELKQKAKDAEAAYEQALADARGEATAIVDKTKAKIQADLKTELADADEKIEAQAAESEAAIAKIRSEAVETAREAANDVASELASAFGVNADADAIKAAVNERIKG